MIIGVPKEIKNNEFRAGLVPSSVVELVSAGHKVLVEKGLGEGIGCPDSDYKDAGATIVATAQEVFEKAEMIVKVKEPLKQEIPLLRKDQVLFTYLHCAADEELTKGLVKSGCIGVAYETIEGKNKSLPLLAPMSEVAGRMSIQEGARFLEKSQGGRGVLLGGVSGVAPAEVAVFGGGTVGLNAARMALGLGANVTVLDKSGARMAYIDEIYHGQIKTLYSNRANIVECLKRSDLVIGAVLIPGAKAPKLVNKADLKLMKKGSVLVDVAIDQGGCFETSKPTTHQNPTFEVEGVVHYCVANMPGGVARTSSFALNNATLPYALALANKGWKDALKSIPGFDLGLNVCKGDITFQAVADAFGMKYVPASKHLA